jgi:hypothetical protein
MRSSSKPVSMLLALLLAACDSPTTTLLEQAARNTAEHWLAKADAGDHAGTWDMTTPEFRVQVRKEDWKARQESAYQQLGKPARRELIAAKYTASVPGVPAGEYVLIQYRRSVSAREPVLETLTMRRAGDEWQMAGYWILWTED